MKINQKIDAVFTWVDGNDSRWINKKQLFLNKNPNSLKNKKVNSKGRFFDNEELKYSLRSISEFAPWVNNIYIVTDNQVPKWLDTSHPKIKIIDHKDIFNLNNLPSFNSMAIEMNLHKIKNLSNYFLSFNDDFFIGRETNEDDFFDNGKPKLFCGKKKLTLDNLAKKVLSNEYQHGNNNARMLIYNKYNYFPNFNLRHSIKVLDKKTIEDLEDTFFEEFENTRSNNFRTRGDVWIMALYAFYSVANGSNQPFYIAPLRKDLIRYKMSYLRRGREYTYLTLTNSSLKKIKSKFSAIRKYNPLMFCINDGPNVSDYKRSITKSFLGKYFPNKSVFEK